jgi:EAL domain-containing protein (putative c-di-GMP-specific phosphodiesterase class I)
MAPNIVKLDRSFTMKAMVNDFERMLMTSTIQMVHSLGLTVCVEGVETEEELQQVHALGADFVQGYYYSKPCPKDEFARQYCC